MTQKSQPKNHQQTSSKTSPHTNHIIPVSFLPNKHEQTVQAKEKQQKLKLRRKSRLHRKRPKKKAPAGSTGSGLLPRIAHFHLLQHHGGQLRPVQRLHGFRGLGDAGPRGAAERRSGACGRRGLLLCLKGTQ